MSKEKTDLLQGTLDSPAGRKQLVEGQSNWERLSVAINTVLKKT